MAHDNESEMNNSITTSQGEQDFEEGNIVSIFGGEGVGDPDILLKNVPATLGATILPPGPFVI